MPSTLVVVFFFFLVRISKVTKPVGMPPPGEVGLISAVSFSETSLFFFKTGVGSRTTEVAACLIDVEAGLEFALGKERVAAVGCGDRIGAGRDERGGERGRARRTEGTVPSGVPSSRKVTVPVGELPADTVAIKVMICP